MQSQRQVLNCHLLVHTHTHTYIHYHVQVQANLQSLQEPEHELADSVGGDAWSALDRGDISMYVYVCMN